MGLKSDNIRYIVGALYLVYGLVKLLMALITLGVPPMDRLAKLPGLSMLYHDDPTISGHLYEYVFVAFAVYTILYGLTMFHMMPNAIASVLEYQHTELILLCILGTFMILFYSLVLFTELPIPKKEDQRKNYMVMGLFGGFSFILLPLMWELLVSFIPVFRTVSKYTRSLIILLAVIAIAMVVSLVIVTISRQRKVNKLQSQQPEASGTSPESAPAPAPASR